MRERLAQAVLRHQPVPGVARRALPLLLAVALEEEVRAGEQAEREDGDGDDAHHDAGGDHDGITAGHYHIYLDTDDDDADHVTAYSEAAELVLPADIAPGTHEIRVSLRAPDHHALGVEDRVTIIVE